MRLNLYSTDLPSGNTVSLANSFSIATGIGASEAVQLAMKLFGGGYSSEKPLELTTKGHSNFDELVDRCKESGIHVTVYEE